jgi:hypothetical protein
MHISPKYTVDDWNNLDLDNNESDWQKAIDMLNDRIRGRYFTPIELLLNADNEKPIGERSFGFAILALDCLLVETFQSFIGGTESSKGKSKEIFVRFLTTRPRFRIHFVKENLSDEEKEKLAKKFYLEYRSGILHQGEIQGDGLVWSVGSLIMQLGNRVVINRTAFHTALKDEFDDYLAQLRSPQETELRENFRKKMDSVCRR